MNKKSIGNIDICIYCKKKYIIKTINQKYCTEKCGYKYRKKYSKCKSNHKLYSVYKGIEQRCYNKNHISYKYYGARNIKMCAKWRHSFESFFNYCIKNGWEEGLQIDRIDNNRGYEENNVRFVTSKENCLNRTSSYFHSKIGPITAFGETKSLSSWSKDTRCKISKDALRERIRKKWNYEKAIVTPSTTHYNLGRTGYKITAFGETKSILGWCRDKRCQVARRTLTKRINERWNNEKAIITPAFQSKQEEVIYKILIKLNINFQYKKIFKNLKSINNGLPVFDFYLISQNILIEYQGKQHYQQIANWCIKTTIKNDQIKKQFAKDNNIPFQIIPYTYDDQTEKIITKLVTTGELTEVEEPEIQLEETV